MKAVSQREFAKQIGRSHVWVSKLVKAGKLPTDASGKILLQAGLKAYEASQQVGYDANREHGEKQRKQSAKAKPASTRTKKATTPKQPPKTETVTIPDDDGEEIEFSAPTGTAAKLSEAFNRAKTAEKTFQAKLKEMEFKEAQGLLIPKEQVIQDAYNTAEGVRSIAYAMPPRVAALCEGKTAREIEAILEDAINEIFEVLQKSKFVKGATKQ